MALVFNGISFHVPILESLFRLKNGGHIGISYRQDNSSHTMIMIHSKSMHGKTVSKSELEALRLSKAQVLDIINDEENPISTPYPEAVIGFLKEYMKEAWKVDEPDKCFGCGCVCDSSYVIDGVQYCKECISDSFSHCSICGELVPHGDLKAVEGCTIFNSNFSIFRGQYFCISCIEDVSKFNTCCLCGERHWKNRLTMIDGDMFCEDCKNDAIAGYHQGPKLQFYGNGKYHMGVEIEVDDGPYDNRLASALRVTKILDKHIFCSKDGSLGTGFEIVSHPHTYQELVSLPWDHAFSALTKAKWRGHNTCTAGLHVHIGRGCFQDDDSITRFCTFFENNWAFVRAFSRRSKDTLNRWAARYKPNALDITKYDFEQIKTMKNETYDRYRAVNLTNRDTVEVRVFRSTLNVNTFLATIELVYLVAEKCNNITNENAEKMSVTEWLTGASDNLLNYCATHGHNCRTENDDVLADNFKEERVCA